MNDHRLIEKVMSALEAKLRSVGDSDFPVDFIEQALDFFTEFADGCHHFKEEEALFPALAECGFAVEGGPIGMMLYEHTIGRKCLAGIRANLPAARAGIPEARAALRSFAAQYIDLLQNHIWKEDNVLFRMAQQALDPQSAVALLNRFHDEHNPRTATPLVERYQSFAVALGEP